MFRELMRKKQALEKEECLDILKSELRGVLSVNGDDGYPYGMPMDHYYNEEDGCIYFHGARMGHKIDALKRDDKVSYCVYAGTKNEGEWWYVMKSVIVFGRMEMIDDPVLTEDISRKLSLRFTDDLDFIENEINASLKGTLLLKLTPEHISGKRINEN